MTKPLSIVVLASSKNPAIEKMVHDLSLQIHQKHRITSLYSDLGYGITRSVPLSSAEKKEFETVTCQIAQADLLILVLAPDTTLACLVGMALISGVPVAAYGNSFNLCPYIVRGCVEFWCENTEALGNAIASLPAFPED